MVVEFKDLRTSDLIVNEIYEGGTVIGKGSEVLSKLFTGVSNSGGFRFQSHAGKQKICLLFANNTKSEWQNTFDGNSGEFIYHGDNNVVGVKALNSNKPGMKFLNRINNAIKSGERKEVPPIFIFVKGYEKGWAVRYIGLAVPGVEGELDFLEVVKTNTDEGEIENYRAKFTVLDIEKVSREWINDISINKIYESEHAPIKWKEWVEFNIYRPIKGKVDSFGKDNHFGGNVIKSKINNKYKEITILQVVEIISSYISSTGYLYTKEDIENFVLSIKTKPFTILSGISGTGKTKIVELFAAAVGATYVNGRFNLVPVRPDWSDSSDLIGYKDLKNEFIPGPLTKIIEEAMKHPTLPYFIVLDEMNLARVEYYLSDFLSVIESRKFNDDGEIVTVPIIEYNGKQLGIPENLYIIGTVNMDETTHPFSKKVLDRANAIEFNEVHLTNFSMLEDEQVVVEPIEVSNDFFKSKYIKLKDAKEHEDIIRKVSEELVEINKQLSKIYAQVAYRVRDEISFYMCYNAEYELLTREEAMDFCIMQKILPRISGAGLDVEELIDNLISLFEVSTENGEVKYPRSVTKLKEMKARYNSQGFVSFWIS